MSNRSDPDRQALDPDPAKLNESHQIRIHNTGLNIEFAPKENVTHAPNERPS
jgi:hypothetical protein